MLSSKCAATKKNLSEFDLSIPGRVYNLKAIEYGADKWVDMLNKEIARLSAPQRTTGLTLEDC